MKEKAFIICVLILLAVHAFAQTDCPSARISLGLSGAGTLKYNKITTLSVLVSNDGDAQANINKVSASLGHTFLSCDSYKVKPKERTECRITVSPVSDKALYVQVDYEYVSCGRTRVAQAQLSIIESKELSPSDMAQVYSIDVHGGCENSYYACSSPSGSGKYSAGYKCYSKEGDYYSPAKERVNIKFNLPQVSPIVLYDARLKISVTAVNKMQDLSLYRISSSWQPVSCQAGGDICTQPYCGECKALFDASGSLISSESVYSTRDLTFDITDAVRKAYSSGQKTLSLQLRGREDTWASSGQSSCGGRNAWQTQDVEIRGDDYGGPRLVLNYLGKDVNLPLSLADDVCTDCCAPGEMTCSVICDGGPRNFGGSPAITDCRYDGSMITVWRGSTSQSQNCVNGRCSDNVTTTSSATTSSVPTTTLSATTSSVATTLSTTSTPVTSSGSTTSPVTTTTLGSGTCIDGTPVGQCSTWMDGLRCVSAPWDFEYDPTCGSTTPTTPTPTTPTPTTPMPTMPTNPMDFCFGTPVGNCSTMMDCFRCVDDPTLGMPYLDYDDTCCGGSTSTFVTTSFSSTSFVSTTFTLTTSATSSSAATSSQATTSGGVTTTTLSACVPAYDPGRWNNNRRALNCNNCYNYGCDTQTDSFAQPGLAHGYSISFDCSSAIQGANADHLKFLGKTNGACTGCTHKVALVIAPGQDFHWYRQDNNGRWSHKPGSTTVRDTDESGNKITSPETANRGIYTSFCGYFCVDKNVISIQGPNSCPY